MIRPLGDVSHVHVDQIFDHLGDDFHDETFDQNLSLVERLRNDRGVEDKRGGKNRRDRGRRFNRNQVR